MEKVVFKDVTGIIYSGTYLSKSENIIEVKNLDTECGASNMTYGVVNLKNKNSHYNGIVSININNVIWYSIQDIEGKVYPDVL